MNNGDKVDGIMLDLGVSSYQLDTADRGFSYRGRCTSGYADGSKVRNDSQDIVNDFSENESLSRDPAITGEIVRAKNIARHIVRERAKRPIETTGELTEVIRHAIPMKFPKEKQVIRPNGRFRQSRIELNREWMYSGILWMNESIC